MAFVLLEILVTVFSKQIVGWQKERDVWMDSITKVPGGKEGYFVQPTTVYKFVAWGVRVGGAVAIGMGLFLLFGLVWTLATGLS